MSIDYQLLRPEHDLIRRGLACLFGGPETSLHARRDSAVHQRLIDFENYAISAGIDASRQVVAMQGDLIAGMCLWVPSPGRTGMLFAPGARQFPDALEALALCIKQAVEDSAKAGLVMVQMLLEPADTPGIQLATAAGLWQLAVLHYMERRTPRFRGTVELPAGFELENYTSENHPDFVSAIEKSYEGTLDCPALTGMRNIEDVVAGHKAVGVFDPNLWHLVRGPDRAVAGCLLLAHVPQRNAIDLVYLGLAPSARGKGLGRALMQTTLHIATERRAALLSLAVDAKNNPAHQLYRRFGYGIVSDRVALVASTSAQ